jgi:putative oxidoreductase
MKPKPYTLLILSLAFVYIVFGLLKVLGVSPIKDLVVQTFSFMDNPLLFGLFGLGEVVLGAGIIIKQTRKISSILIILHILSTFLTILLAPSAIFNPVTLVTLEGEFVLKNVMILAIGYYIYSQEA